MKADVMGAKFHSLTLSEAVNAGVSLIGTGCHRVVTPNSEIVYEALKNPELMELINTSSLVLPDGIGVVYASKILGCPVKQKVAGIDFAQGLMEALAGTDKTFYFLGSKPGVADGAKEKLLEKYPGLNIVGTADGYFKDDAAAAEKIRQTGADVVFVCLGAPKQEFWIKNHGEATGASLLIGLGGCLDVFSGNVNRAPDIMIKLGLEWLYRLYKEPKRIGRMCRLPLFLFKAVGTRLRGK
ncbi:MAG: WecB/TagA/CpsF family glycosyltransferase [Oscillospiraceae bacterium]|nr:WecB/TagA/CpsF family glycosyltransferase [Oscillospiraceae bacterium]